jgi:hypothetical protein
LDMIRTERVGSWVLGYIDMVSALALRNCFTEWGSYEKPQMVLSFSPAHTEFYMRTVGTSAGTYQPAGIPTAEFDPAVVLG